MIRNLGYSNPTATSNRPSVSNSAPCSSPFIRSSTHNKDQIARLHVAERIGFCELKNVLLMCRFAVLHWIVLLFLPVYTAFACSCNDRSREQLHLERRQALRDRQREAVSEGRSVRSVIETEVEPETTQCPRMTCVRMAPRLKTHHGVNTADVYERLSLGDETMQKMRMEKEKPPQVEIPVQKTAEKGKEMSQESSQEEYPDERDKFSIGETSKDTSSSNTGSSLF